MGSFPSVSFLCVPFFPPYFDSDTIHSARLAEEYNLELQYRKPFLDVWKEEKDDPELGPLSERMGVRGRGAGPLLVSEEELEAASKL
jgi:mRNA (guanine-N7-)-methyltransferase